MSESPGPFLDVWVNCPDQGTAERIASACLEERLAACANVLAPIDSVYWWKGRLESAREVPLVLKTRASLFEALAAQVRSCHPYEIPSIVATELPLMEPAYAAWLAEETQEPV